MWNRIQSSTGRSLLSVTWGHLQLLLKYMPWFKWIEVLGNKAGPVLHILHPLMERSFSCWDKVVPAETVSSLCLTIVLFVYINGFVFPLLRDVLFTSKQITEI